MRSRLISRKQVGSLTCLCVGHAGDRLVHQQELWVLRQQHADLEPLLLAVRQAAGDPLAHGLQPDDLQDAVDAALALGGVAPEQRCARPPVALEREQDVVLDRVHLEHGRLLELAADSELSYFGLVEMREVVRSTVEVHVALIGPRLAGDHVHHRGLAGAVGTDDRPHLAGLDGQAKDC